MEVVLGPGISHQAESGALGAASSLIPDQWGAAHRRRCAGASQRASQAQVGAGWTPPSWGGHAPRASSAHAARKRGRAGHPPRGSWGGHAPRASSTLAARIAGATQVLRRRLARALKKKKWGGGGTIAQLATASSPQRVRMGGGGGSGSRHLSASGKRGTRGCLSTYPRPTGQPLTQPKGKGWGAGVVLGPGIPHQRKVGYSGLPSHSYPANGARPATSGS